MRVRRNALVDGELWRAATPWQRHALRARAVAAGGTHASPLDAVRPEAGTEEYDEHEVVPLPVPVVVTRAGRVFPPASTVQDARKALWSRA